MVELGRSISSAYSRTCLFMRRRPSHSTLDVASIICGDHWNLSGIQLMLFNATTKSRGFQTLRGAVKFLHQVSPMAVSAVSHRFLLQTMAFSPAMVELGRSIGSAYSRTFLFMRWRPSHSTLDVASIICGDHWNLSGIQLMLFNATPKSRGFQTLRGAVKFLHQVSPMAVSAVSHSFWMFFALTVTYCIFPWVREFNRQSLFTSSMSSGCLRTCHFMRWNSSYSTAGRSKSIIWADG